MEKRFLSHGKRSNVPIVLAAGDFKTKSIHLGKQISVEDIQDQKLRKHHGRITRILQKNYSKISRKVGSKSTNLKLNFMMTNEKKN